MKFQISTSTAVKNSASKKGGERGIRTPGTLRHTGFRDRHIRPLCHLSGGMISVSDHYLLLN